MTPSPAVRWWAYTPSVGPSWWTPERHELAVAKLVAGLMVDVPLLAGILVLGVIA